MGVKPRADGKTSLRRTDHARTDRNNHSEQSIRRHTKSASFPIGNQNNPKIGSPKVPVIKQAEEVSEISGVCQKDRTASTFSAAYQPMGARFPDGPWTSRSSHLSCFPSESSGRAQDRDGLPQQSRPASTYRFRHWLREGFRRTGSSFFQLLCSSC